MKNIRVELTFTESKNKDSKPIARYNGKVCLIPGHKTALPGETWLCEILEDFPSQMKVMPLERIRTKKENQHKMNIKLGMLIAKLQIP